MFAQFVNRFFQSGFLLRDTQFVSGVVPFVLGSLQIVLVLDLFAQLLYGAYEFLAFSPTILDVHSQSHKGWHRAFLTAVSWPPRLKKALQRGAGLHLVPLQSRHSEQQAFPPYSFDSNQVFVLRCICFCQGVMSNLFHFAYLHRLGIELITQGFHLSIVPFFITCPKIIESFYLACLRSRIVE